MNKNTKILIIFIGIGIAFSILSGNFLFAFAMGGVGKAIVGQYSLPAPTYPYGKLIGGCYGQCPSSVDCKQKTMGACSAAGGL